MSVFKQRRTKYEPVYYGIINKKILIARSLKLSVNEANFEEDTATQKSENLQGNVWRYRPRLSGRPQMSCKFVRLYSTGCVSFIICQ